METNITNYGHSKTFVNDNLVHTLDWNANYDGENANAEIKSNNKKMYISLSNDDIIKIISNTGRLEGPSIEGRLNTLLQSMPKHHHRKGTRKARHRRTRNHRRRHKTRHKVKRKRGVKSRKSRHKRRSRKMTRTPTPYPVEEILVY